VSTSPSGSSFEFLVLSFEFPPTNSGRRLRMGGGQLKTQHS
jgi:hypothetical protein